MEFAVLIILAIALTIIMRGADIRFRFGKLSGETKAEGNIELPNGTKAKGNLQTTSSKQQRSRNN